MYAQKKLQADSSCIQWGFYSNLITFFYLVVSESYPIGTTSISQFHLVHILDYLNFVVLMHISAHNLRIAVLDMHAIYHCPTMCEPISY